MSSVNIIDITERISYIPACEKPLSSDIGIIRGDRQLYLFDVGSTLEDLNYLHSLDKPPVIIISHFHADHTWWLTEHHEGDPDVSPEDHISTCYERPQYSDLYVGPLSYKHTGDGTIVRERITLNDGIKLDIIPIPSSHCKGSLALMIDDSYLFLGDSTYSCKSGYNVGLLQAQIKLLESLPAETVFLSHDRHFSRPKSVVLRQLKSYYARRTPGDVFIS